MPPAKGGGALENVCTSLVNSQENSLRSSTSHGLIKATTSPLKLAPPIIPQTWTTTTLGCTMVG